MTTIIALINVYLIVKNRQDLKEVENLKKANEAFVLGPRVFWFVEGPQIVSISVRNFFKTWIRFVFNMVVKFNTIFSLR